MKEREKLFSTCTKLIRKGKQRLQLIFSAPLYTLCDFMNCAQVYCTFYGRKYPASQSPVVVSKEKNFFSFSLSVGVGMRAPWERDITFCLFSYILFPLSIFSPRAELSEWTNATTSILETTFHLNIFVSFNGSADTSRAFSQNPGRLKKMRQILSKLENILAASFSFLLSS